MISGAYSMARQCVQLGFLPRLTVRHTSNLEEGQIYLPQVNGMMLVGVTILVLSFKTSDNLAAAYGIAVTGTFLCTSVLATVVFRREFHWSRPTAVIVFGFFFVVDLLYFTSNLLKVPEGGWVPLVLGLALTAIMTTWKRGRDLLLARWRHDSLPLPHSWRACRNPAPSACLAWRCSSPERLTTSPPRFYIISSTTRCCTSGSCSSQYRTSTCRRRGRIGAWKWPSSRLAFIA